MCGPRYKKLSLKKKNWCWDRYSWFREDFCDPFLSFLIFGVFLVPKSTKKALKEPTSTTDIKRTNQFLLVAMSHCSKTKVSSQDNESWSGD